MREIELAFAKDETDEQVCEHLEEAARLAGLVIGSGGTLRCYPGCVHWHLTKPGSKGTLEATWWPSRQRLWLKVHPRREADWIDAAIWALASSMGER